jgi:hypothetical protein
VTIQQEAAVNDDIEEFEESGNARVSKPLEADRPGKRNGEGRGSGRAKGRAERGIGLPPFPER